MPDECRYTVTTPLPVYALFYAARADHVVDDDCYFQFKYRWYSSATTVIQKELKIY